MKIIDDDFRKPDLNEFIFKIVGAWVILILILVLIGYLISMI